MTGRTLAACAAACLFAAALAGCRLDAPPPDASTVDADSLAPPVLAGDTARVAPGGAAVATPDAVERVVTAPSGLVVPVVGVELADLVDTFDDARSEGRVHDAIDILAPRGTPVVAAAAGTVARLFTSERGGRTVYVLGAAPLAGGRQLVYYYAHLEGYAPGLADGQTVRAGQLVGTVGDSGNAVPGNTHLHFAMWTVTDPAQFWDGELVNPYRPLGGRPRQARP